MKQMVGIPDEHFTSGKMRDRHVNYPQALPSHRHQLLVEAPDICWLKNRLTSEEYEAVNDSALAYVVGNSQKISASMVDMLNAIHFPKVVAVAVIPEITVAAGTTHTFGTPGDQTMPTIVVGVLNVEPGGSIVFASSCNLEVQHTEILAAPTIRSMEMTERLMAAARDLPPTGGTINIYSPAPLPPDPPPPQGSRGTANGATPGTCSFDKHNNPDGCTTQGIPGSNGDTGWTGSTGGKGDLAHGRDHGGVHIQLRRGKCSGRSAGREGRHWRAGWEWSRGSWRKVQ
jgi:hypothetical protein